MAASGYSTNTQPAKPTPPMMKGTPIIGHAREFMRDRSDLFRRGLEQYGPVFGIKLANRSAAVLIGPEYHEIFFGETDKSLSMDKTYKFLMISRRILSRLPWQMGSPPMTTRSSAW